LHIFKPKVQIWVNFGGLFWMEDVGRFYGRLVYFTAVGYILWPLGIFCGHWVYSSLFGMLYQEKSGNPAACPFWGKNLHAYWGSSKVDCRYREDVAAAGSISKYVDRVTRLIELFSYWAIVYIVQILEN
jgi:hypothetical protein